MKELKFINHKVRFQLFQPDWCAAAAENQTMRFNVTGLGLCNGGVWPHAGDDHFKCKPSFFFFFFGAFMQFLASSTEYLSHSGLAV